jgi:DNA adenine methylase/adenine-specific DNA-methyltransferase
MTLDLPTASPPVASASAAAILSRAALFPRLRYMGSKYRLAGSLQRVFGELGGTSALDAFSGSGFVSYLLKAQGFAVTSNDFLTFSSTIARATVQNSTVTLPDDVVEQICAPNADGRDFIATKFAGLYLSAADLEFLDSAWSHVDSLAGAERDIAISALVLSAARKQPRGVFTYTGNRYDDGRRDLRLSMEEQFRLRVEDYNRTVFDNGASSVALNRDVAEIPAGPYDVVYLDPPYAPPSDDADYMKRYHFLEGLSVYWRDREIMEETKTKKIAKKFTPFAYKRTVEDALAATFEKFRDSGAIVLSYSSNAVPGAQRILELLAAVKPHVELREIDHSYSFGTHATAARNSVREYLFIGRE